jgi:hypothetical protein
MKIKKMNQSLSVLFFAFFTVTPEALAGLMCSPAAQGQEFAEMLARAESQVDDVISGQDNKMKRILDGYNQVMGAVWSDLKTQATNNKGLRRIVYSLSSSRPIITVSNGSCSTLTIPTTAPTTWDWIETGTGAAPTAFQAITPCEVKRNIEIFRTAFQNDGPSACRELKRGGAFAWLKDLTDSVVPNAMADFNYGINGGYIEAGASVAAKFGLVGGSFGGSLIAGIVKAPVDSKKDADLFFGVTVQNSLAGGPGTGISIGGGTSYGYGLLFSKTNSCVLSNYNGVTSSIAGAYKHANLTLGLVPFSSKDPANSGPFKLKFGNGTSKPAAPIFPSASNSTSASTINLNKLLILSAIQSGDLGVAQIILGSMALKAIGSVIESGYGPPGNGYCGNIAFYGSKDSSSAQAVGMLSTQATFFNTATKKFGVSDGLILATSFVTGMTGTAFAAANGVPPEQTFWIGLGSFLIPMTPSVAQAAFCATAYQLATFTNSLTISNSCRDLAFSPTGSYQYFFDLGKGKLMSASQSVQQGMNKIVAEITEWNDWRSWQWQ